MSSQQSHISGNKPPVPVFLASAVVIFFLSLSTADSVGFVPYYIDGTEPTVSAVTDTPSVDTRSIASADEVSLADLPMLGDEEIAKTQLKSTPVVAQKPVAPTRIVADSIGLDLVIQNTATRDLAKLDTALERGPVRYIDSAQLNVPGNMLIFAHSSHLPIVHNKMYQAFNRLPELVAGDTISVYGADGKQYLYNVTSVRKTDAADALIDLSTSQGTKLTLSTCDTLTSKASRFVVEADFVGML